MPPEKRKIRHHPETCCQALRQQGLRVTPPRKALLQTLATSNTPLSAEDLHARIADTRADLATVYRNLLVLEQAGLASCHLSEKGTRLFVATPARHSGALLLCRVCHRAEPLGDATVRQLTDRASRKGYAALRQPIEIHGLCPTCQTTEGRSPRRQPAPSSRK